MRISSWIGLALFCLVAGCSTGPSVEGKWNITGMKGVPKDTTFTATFAKPNTVTMVMDMSQDIPGAKPIKLHADIMGKYSIQGDVMAITADDAKFKADGVPDSVKPQMEGAMTKMGSDAKDNINKNSRQKMTWSGNDSFTLAGSDGESSTFTRVK